MLATRQYFQFADPAFRSPSSIQVVHLHYRLAAARVIRPGRVSQKEPEPVKYRSKNGIYNDQVCSIHSHTLAYQPPFCNVIRGNTTAIVHIKLNFHKRAVKTETNIIFSSLL